MFQTPEQGEWYCVFVGQEAEFITYAYDEDYARLKVDLYLGENPGVKVPNLLDFDIWAKPLDPLEADQQAKLKVLAPSVSVKLVGVSKPLCHPTEQVPKTKPEQTLGQLVLFAECEYYTKKGKVIDFKAA